MGGGLYGDALPMSLPLIPFKMISVRGSYVGSLQEMHELMDLLKTGKVPPIPIEPRSPSQADQALTDLKESRVLGRNVLKS